MVDTKTSLKNRKFGRFNIFQIGIVPLHVFLMIYISKMPFVFAHIDIPQFLENNAEPVYIHILILGSVRAIVYMLLYVITIVLFLSFLDYIEFCINRALFEEDAVNPKFFSVFCILCMVYVFSFSALGENNTYTITSISDLLQGSSAFSFQDFFSYFKFSDIVIIFLLSIPIFLLSFDIHKIYLGVRIWGISFVRTINTNEYRKVIEFSKEDKKLIEESPDREVYLDVLSKYISRQSWLSSLQALFLLRVSYFAFMLMSVNRRIPSIAFVMVAILIAVCYLILSSHYKDYLEHKSFYQEISLNWKNKEEREVWINNYHKTVAVIEHNRKNQLAYDYSEIKRSAYEDILIILLQLWGTDNQKVNQIHALIKNKLYRNEWAVCDILNKTCGSIKQKVIIEDCPEDLILFVNEDVFGKMAGCIFNFMEIVGFQDANIVFRHFNDCIISCQFAVSCDSIDNIERTLMLFQFPEGGISSNYYDATYIEPLIYAQIYASLNGVKLVYELIGKQVFSIKVQ